MQTHCGLRPKQRRMKKAFGIVFKRSVNWLCSAPIARNRYNSSLMLFAARIGRRSAYWRISLRLIRSTNHWSKIFCDGSSSTLSSRTATRPGVCSIWSKTSARAVWIVFCSTAGRRPNRGFRSTVHCPYRVWCDSMIGFATSLNTSARRTSSIPFSARGNYPKSILRSSLLPAPARWCAAM